MNNLAFADIATLRTMLGRGEISYDELLDFYLQRFASHDPRVKSALEVFDRESIGRADCAGPLRGIPGLIKDNICMKDRHATCASKILDGFVSSYDATAVSRLKGAGAALVGRANMDEFAMGSSTETSAYHQTCNPWDLERVPGGSSGGSAAAVAAGLVPWSLGTDTGGSVRQPAGFCGIVGMKPTYGLVSRYGLVAYGSSLDTIGVFTRSVADNAAVMSVIAGHDVHDSSSLAVEDKDYTARLEQPLPDKLRIGVIENALEENGMDSEVVASLHEAIGELEKLGAEIVPLSLPILDYSAAAYFILSRAEAASNLARFDGVRYGNRVQNADTLTEMYEQTRHDGFGHNVRSRILVGNYVLSAGHAQDYYENAKKVKRLIRRDILDIFNNVSLMLMPTHPAPAFKFGTYDDNKLQMDLQDYFTCFVNLSGVPAISVPCGQTKSRLPIGMQLVGPHLSEELIYRVTHAYQRATSWHTLHPEGF